MVAGGCIKGERMRRVASGQWHVLTYGFSGLCQYLPRSLCAGVVNGDVIVLNGPDAREWRDSIETRSRCRIRTNSCG